MRSCSPRDPVHDLQRALAGPAAGRAGHERDELLGLVRAGADVQRLERQARVADPRVAVVPVALAPDRLRQRGGRRGDDRSGRPVREALEHARAEPHQLAVRALVHVVLGLPRAPRLDRVLDPRRDLVRRERLRRRAFRRRPLQREPDPLARRHGEGSGHRRVLDRGRHAGADDHLVRSAERPAARLGRAEQRLDQPVLGPGRQLEAHLHLAENSLHQAQQQMRRAEAELVTALTLCERHRVGEPHAAGLGRERRLDHQRPGQVATLAAIRARRPDLPMPTVRIEDPREHRRAVVARQAQPANRPVAVDQRGRVAVGQQAVVGDRPRTLVRHGRLRPGRGCVAHLGSDLEVRAWAFVRRRSNPLHVRG